MRSDEKFVMASPYQYVCTKCKVCTGGYWERTGDDLKCSCGAKLRPDPLTMDCLHLRLGANRGQNAEFRRCLDCGTLMKKIDDGGGT